MSKNRTGPARSDWEGITLFEAVNRFGNPGAAENWLIDQRWPDCVRCIQCNGAVKPWARKDTTLAHWWRCSDSKCNKRFNIKTGSVMQQSKHSLDKWCLALFLATTNLKGVSSMNLHRDLGIPQKSAWHLGQRIRKSFEDANPPTMKEPVEGTRLTSEGIKTTNASGSD